MEKQTQTLRGDRKGIFGLNAVQTFFAVILGIGLLAYVIVVVMGTLSANTTILPVNSATVVNESVANFTVAGVQVANAGLSGFSNFAVSLVLNASNATGQAIPASNYTVTGDGRVQAVANSPWLNEDINVSYTYTYFTRAGTNANTILVNTSTGITNFFTSVNPVYAILAILVIILVLVVLVRVVTNQRDGTMGASDGPSL